MRNSLSVQIARPRRRNLFKVLGPGLITGAADDDPSGIATYSQAGARFGYQMAWVLVFSYPLMAVTQTISARIGSVTGRGIARNLKLHYPPFVLRAVVIALLIANVANLGADLGAMAAAFQLLVGGPLILYTIGFAALCILLEVFTSYARYTSYLKWLTLSLFSYVAVVFAVHVPWASAIKDTFIPTLVFDSDHAEVIVAVLGTTISPYLFFWQASQEVEEQLRRATKPLCVAPSRAGPELERIRTDTWVGMGYSNIIAIFIIFATAATLHASGVTNIETSSEAAEALRPLAGDFTFAVFACGIIGTGLLAVPVLAGSAAYAVSETFNWTEGLDHKLKDARAFYATIAIAMLVGLGLNFLNIRPIKALFWCAVLNGLLAAPLMASMLLIATNRKVMGKLKLSGPMAIAGWLAAGVMAAASVAFLML
jgi:NRAMP (natural resistance-associated macrophage protein)-like metal ion transporter